MDNWTENDRPLNRTERRVLEHDKLFAIPWKNHFPPIPFSELLSKEYPPRSLLLSPWLPERSLSMIHGPRGVGKTFLTLSIALAVSSEYEFLGWKGAQRKRVLYIDGEVTCSELQQRCRALVGKRPIDFPLDFMPRDAYQRMMPRLDNGDFRRSIGENLRDDTGLIIIDNLSTLWRGKENDADSWLHMQDWLAEHKQKGRSVLLVHHTNKNGDQRGSNRKEDNLDVVIGLRRPDGYKASEGARFSIEFTKARSFHGAGAESFEASLLQTTDNRVEWKRETLKPQNTYGRVNELRLKGLPQHEIARQLGIDKSVVSRHFQRAHEVEASQSPTC